MTDPYSEASRWLALRSKGERLPACEARQFEQWLEVGTNRADYSRLERLYREAGAAELFTAKQVRETLASTALEASRRRRSLKTWSGWAYVFRANSGSFITAAAIVALAFVFWFKASLPGRSTPYETRLGEHKIVQLSDGSQVELDGGTRFATRYSKRERNVEGFDGRAVFTVQGDAARPFVIETGRARVRVIGTQFQVDRHLGSVDVTVLKGVVEVASSRSSSDAGSPPAPAVTLRAGERARVSDRGDISGISSYTTTDFAAWRSGRIDFRERPLHEVVSEAARYFDGTVVIREEALRTLSISGSFKTGEPVDFLTTLELIAPVEVVRVSARLIEIRSRR
ncbi:MAG: FecR domain-containing protein [Rariglobus sp.]